MHGNQLRQPSAGLLSVSDPQLGECTEESVAAPEAEAWEVWRRPCQRFRVGKEAQMQVSWEFLQLSLQVAQAFRASQVFRALWRPAPGRAASQQCWADEDPDWLLLVAESL